MCCYCINKGYSCSTGVTLSPPSVLLPEPLSHHPSAAEQNHNQPPHRDLQRLLESLSPFDDHIVRYITFSLTSYLKCWQIQNATIHKILATALNDFCSFYHLYIFLLMPASPHVFILNISLQPLRCLIIEIRNVPFLKEFASVALLKMGNYSQRPILA